MAGSRRVALEAIVIIRSGTVRGVDTCLTRSSANVSEQSQDHSSELDADSDSLEFIAVGIPGRAQLSLIVLAL